MTTLAGTAYRRPVGVAGEPTVGRATALVAVVMCLAAVSETSYSASNGGLGEVPTVAALFVLPLLYVFAATRPLWLRHRYLLLAAQADADLPAVHLVSVGQLRYPVNQVP
jgi:hypothetical protein